MRVAVVGAGFAGLAAAYQLSQHHAVTLFDAKGIGGGASGVSSGLLHPYPGEKGRRSWHAEEAIAATKELLRISEEMMGKPVANYNGILRLGPCLNPGSDVEKLGEDRYLIQSGITVFTELYLEGLWRGCEKKGVKLVLQKITSLQELDAFDQVVLAMGPGIRDIPQNLKINFVKGQALTCSLDRPLERSISAKRYTALTARKEICHIGSTYEREFIDELPNIEVAKKLLHPDATVLDCRAGVRVTNPAHYFPIVEKINPKTWVMTALGSRGLLYHAFLASSLEKLCCTGHS